MSERPCPEDPDAELVRRVAQRDAAACAALVDRYLKRVQGMAMRLLGNRADANEVSQEVFLRVWTQASRWREELGSFSTWLYRIVINASQDVRRKRRPDVELDSVELPSTADGPERTTQTTERERLLHEALTALPDRQREALVMFHYEGLSQADAAAALEISQDALESLLARARRSLRERLQSQLGK
jgi:RNA polymerase sigma-70 factor, ECF subfamily